MVSGHIWSEKLAREERAVLWKQQTPSWAFYCILESPGILCDVRSVVVTPTAAGASVHCLQVLVIAMLARLSRLLERQKGEHHHTRGRQKEAGL